MKELFFFILLCLIKNFEVTCQQYGEECMMSGGGQGICLNFFECVPALFTPRGERGDIRKCVASPDQVTKYQFICCRKERSQRACQTYYRQQGHKLIIGAYGTPTLPKEFPHMAVLGYDDGNNINWGCGGSLISEQFVLTAAHCVQGSLKLVRLGDLDINSTTDKAEPKNFTISAQYVHPSYKSPSHYHDIALLKLDRKVNFTDYIMPACLHVDKAIPDNNLIATGWGNIEGEVRGTTHMLKVNLNQVDLPTCNNRFRSAPKRRLKNGIVDDFQICAGHPSGRDTCRGDSGGPLQIQVAGDPGFHKIIGVTSFGKYCGFENSVGVYTRVSNYIEWIENIVWPKSDDNIYFPDEK